MSPESSPWSSPKSRYCRDLTILATYTYQISELPVHSYMNNTDIVNNYINGRDAGCGG